MTVVSKEKCDNCGQYPCECPPMLDCPSCDGIGQFDDSNICQVCEGSGEIEG